MEGELKIYIDDWPTQRRFLRRGAKKENVSYAVLFFLKTNGTRRYERTEKRKKMTSPPRMTVADERSRVLREPTPILNDLKRFFGVDSVPTDARYPLVVEMDPRCTLHTLITEILSSKRLFDFDPSRVMPDMKLWMHVPKSVEECYERFLSFLGFVYVRLYYADTNEGEAGGGGDRRWHDFYHGSYYLPIGCFARDPDLRVLGRVVVRGKEKYFTTFEGISSDIPCVCRDNSMASLKYSKIVRSRLQQQQRQHQDQRRNRHRGEGGDGAHGPAEEPSAPPQQQQQRQTAGTAGATHHKELWDRSFDGSSRLVRDVARKISCTFKAYHSTNHTPVNVVHGMTSNGTRITSLCTYSPHSEQVLVTRDDYECFLARPENADIAVPLAVAVMQYDACVSGYKGVTNTNSYVYKTIKQPSQILADHVLKCVRKNFRTKCLVPPNTGTRTLAKILCINHTNINNLTSHYSRFVLSSTCESLFAAVANEHRTVVNFYKTNKQSYMRQLQSTQMGYVSATATPDGADIGMAKHLTFGTSYTWRAPDFHVRLARERVLRLLGDRVVLFTDENATRLRRALADTFLDKLFPPGDAAEPAGDGRNRAGIGEGIALKAFADDGETKNGKLLRLLPFGTCVVFFNNKPCALYEPSDHALERPPELLALTERVPRLHIHYERMAALYLFMGMSGKLEDVRGVAQSNAAFRGACGSGRCLTDHVNPWSKHNDAVRNTLGFSMIKQAVSRTGTVHNSEVKQLLNAADGAEYVRATVLPMAMGHCVEDGMVVSRSFVNRAVYVQTKHASIASNLRGAKITLGAPPSTLVPYESTSLWGLPRGAPIVYGEPVIAVRLPADAIPDGAVAVETRRKGGPSGLRDDDRSPRFAVILFGKRSHYNFTFQSCRWSSPHQPPPSPVRCATTSASSSSCASSKVVYTIARAMTPTYGYKFATIHGQKGVVCKILEDDQMPRGTITGTVPDVIVHPNTLLSRLTIGQLLEDSEIEHRVRERYVVPTLGNALTAHELEPHDVTLFHQRNVPEDKFHMRNKMAVFNIFTRQPMEGRANEGSARMGEMECSAFMATGATLSLSRLGRSCQPDCDSRASQCSVCGVLRPRGDEDTFQKCLCPADEPGRLELHKRIKYAGSLSAHILNAMRVGVRIRQRNDDDDDRAAARPPAKKRGRFGSEESE